MFFFSTITYDTINNKKSTLTYDGVYCLFPLSICPYGNFKLTSAFINSCALISKNFLEAFRSCFRLLIVILNSYCQALLLLDAPIIFNFGALNLTGYTLI